MAEYIDVLVVETEAQRAQLSRELITICSYQTKSGDVVDGIDVSYANEFPELRQITVEAPKSAL